MPRTWQPLLLAHKWRPGTRPDMHGMLVAELILTQERESMSFTESEGVSEATEWEGRCQIYWGQHPRVR